MIYQEIKSYFCCYLYLFKDKAKYNPFERDLAVVNIFFGKATAIGKKKRSFNIPLHIF